MSSLMDDYFVEQQNMGRNYEELKKLDPTHELVRILSGESGFWDRYPKEDFPRPIYAYAEYNSEVRAAIATIKNSPEYLAIQQELDRRAHTDHHPID